MMSKELLQEEQYLFPYHHLPQASESGVWEVARTLWWGYEYLAVLEVVLGELLHHRPKRVLDFGCGDGRLIYELKRKGIPEIVGVDLSERALCFARGFLPDSSVLLYKDLNQISGISFDAVVAVEVLEHLSDHALVGVLSGLHSILADDGIFIVTVPTTNVPLIPKHYRHYTVDLLRKQTSGLFLILQTKFVHHLGMASSLIRHMIINRFFVLTSKPCLRLAAMLYRKFSMYAEPSSGAHLIAIMKKSVEV
jgi:2-polyprenyl-3-methyl-5-hydroxy-6-metoxy-1,4-benzoquinol methylase